MSKKNIPVEENDNFEDELFDVEGYDNVIVLEDEDGKETEFELLDIINYKDEDYLVLTAAEVKENADVIILKAEAEDGSDEETYVGIENKKLMNTIYDIFKEKHKDDFNFVN